MLRENSSGLILLAFGISEIHTSGMKMLILLAILQSLNLVVFVWFHRVALLRILALRHQLGVCNAVQFHFAEQLQAEMRGRGID